MKARGNVENWLGLVEESMMVSLKKLTKLAITDFATKPRHEWATLHASQVCVFPLMCSDFVFDILCSVPYAIWWV